MRATAEARSARQPNHGVFFLGLGVVFLYLGGRGLVAFTNGIRAAWSDPTACVLGLLAGVLSLWVGSHLVKNATLAREFAGGRGRNDELTRTLAEADKLEDTDPVAARQLLDGYFARDAAKTENRRAELRQRSYHDPEAAVTLRRELEEEVERNARFRKEVLKKWPELDRTIARLKPLREGTIAMNRAHYGAAVAGALLLTVPGSLRQEPTNPAAAVAKSPILVRAEEMRWEACSAALPRGPQCATLEGDRTVANVPFTYRLKIPDGYHIPPHFHPADGHLTVIAGTLNIGFGDKLDVKATKAMPAGSFIVIPRGAHHFYWTRGETIVQSQGIGPWGVAYVNPADDPRKR